MSTTSSITIIEYGSDTDRQNQLVPIIQHLGGQLDLSGCVNGFYPDEDGDLDYLSVPIEDQDPFELANDLIANRNVTVLDFSMMIDGEKHYFTLFAYPDRISIVIHSNRVTIAGGRHTDFTWYHDIFITKLSGIFIRVDCIEYSDLLI